MAYRSHLKPYHQHNLNHDQIYGPLSGIFRFSPGLDEPTVVIGLGISLSLVRVIRGGGRVGEVTGAASSGRTAATRATL